MDRQPTWIILPAMANEELTTAALSDCLAQSVPVRVLLIGQGLHGDWRNRLEQLAEEEPRLLNWWADPPLPSLAATWNRALQFVWEVGGTEALVVNNDVRLRPYTISKLQAALTWPKKGNLFVSAVGVTKEQFEQEDPDIIPADTDPDASIPVLDATFDSISKGGPDFSCFLISQAGHWKYPFDEGFIPAFCEDLDTHRRYMLGGDGERIFSINLPFHHVGAGSQTLKSMTPAQRQKHEAKIAISRAHYRAKWGGDVNQERWTIPFDAASDQDGVTTPDLQRTVQGDTEAGPVRAQLVEQVF